MDKEIVRMKESEYNKLTEEQKNDLSESVGKDGEIQIIQDEVSNPTSNEQLTYFELPIEIDEKEILKNKSFKSGLEEGYKLGGVLVAMINTGFSRELAEQFAVESILLDKKLEISKLEQEGKSLENDMNSL